MWFPSPLAAADLHFPTTGDLAEPYSAAMDTSDPALVTVAVGLAKSSGVGKTMDVRSGQVAISAEPSAMGVARKRLGTVFVQGGVPAPGAAAAASEPQAKERVAVGKRKQPSPPVPPPPPLVPPPLPPPLPRAPPLLPPLPRAPLRWFSTK